MLALPTFQNLQIGNRRLAKLFGIINDILQLSGICYYFRIVTIDIALFNLSLHLFQYRFETDTGRMLTLDWIIYTIRPDQRVITHTFNISKIIFCSQATATMAFDTHALFDKVLIPDDILSENSLCRKRAR